MGGDGGSIPGRADLVKLKTRGVKLDQTELLIAQWFFCTLSKNNLQPPIVACGLGKLYNRDAVIEYLLDKDRYGEADVICPHISSIKDVINLNLTMNPAYDESAHGHTNPTSTTTQSSSDSISTANLRSRFICPITGKEMNGKYRFVFLDSCGCVFSEQALKEVKTNLCMKCNAPFTPDNVIQIYPKTEELPRLQHLMELRKQRLHSKSKKEKKDKKDKKSKSKNSKQEDGEPESNSSKSPSSKRKLEFSVPSDHGHPPSKKQHTTVNTSAVALPSKLNQLLQAKMAHKSDAIASIYTKNKKDGKEGDDYMVRGTVTRF